MTSQSEEKASNPRISLPVWGARDASEGSYGECGSLVAYLVTASSFFNHSVKTEENEGLKSKDHNRDALKTEERKTKKHNAINKNNGFPVTDPREMEALLSGN